MDIVRKTLICIIAFILVAAFCFSFINNYAYAATGLSQGEPSAFEGKDDPPGAESVKKIRDVVVTITRIISATIALVTILVLGMKYMYSAPGDRADIKKHAIVYIVGAFILFALPGIIGILIDVGESFNK
ncbi:MAG: hypothetical protein K6D97_01060 [Clostridia bacterium]|nr:hypothetical protein [Clostridia bacterium]